MIALIFHVFTSIAMLITFAPALSHFAMVLSILAVLGWSVIIIRCKSVTAMYWYTGFWLAVLMGMTGILGPLAFIFLLPLLGLSNLLVPSMPNWVLLVTLAGLSLLCVIRIFGKNNLE